MKSISLFSSSFFFFIGVMKPSAAKRIRDTTPTPDESQSFKKHKGPLCTFPSDNAIMCMIFAYLLPVVGYPVVADPESEKKEVVVNVHAEFRFFKRFCTGAQELQDWQSYKMLSKYHQSVLDNKFKDHEHSLMKAFLASLGKHLSIKSSYLPFWSDSLDRVPRPISYMLTLLRNIQRVKKAIQSITPLNQYWDKKSLQQCITRVIPPKLRQELPIDFLKPIYISATVDFHIVLMILECLKSTNPTRKDNVLTPNTENLDNEQLQPIQDMATPADIFCKHAIGQIKRQREARERKNKKDITNAKNAVTRLNNLQDKMEPYKIPQKMLERCLKMSKWTIPLKKTGKRNTAFWEKNFTSIYEWLLMSDLAPHQIKHIQPSIPKPVQGMTYDGYRSYLACQNNVASLTHLS